MRVDMKRPGLVWPSLFTVGAAAAGFLLLSATAEAAPLCNKRATVLKTLERDYGEKPVAFGITTEGALVQLVADKGRKTWTIVIHTPEGTSCLLAAGRSWRNRPPQPKLALRAGGPR